MYLNLLNFSGAFPIWENVYPLADQTLNLASKLDPEYVKQIEQALKTNIVFQPKVS